MRSNTAHITGWLIIVLVTVGFIGEAYGSPTGAFDRWEQSRLVRPGDGVEAVSWGEAFLGQAGDEHGDDRGAWDR